MYILHIETSTPVCSVAVAKGKEVLAFEDLTETMNHTAILAPAIQKMMEHLGLAMKNLDAIAVSSGPGSYTGLRVGSSTAKALAYALDKPLISIPTLSALAAAVFARHPEAKMALPMLDARRKEVYTALYDRSLHPIWPTFSQILDEEFFGKTLSGLPEVVAAGDGAVKIGVLGDLTPQLTVDESLRCSALHMVSVATEAYAKGKFEAPLHFVPFYMKPPNITQPRSVQEEK